MTKVSVYLGRREILLEIGKPEGNSNLFRFYWLRGLDLNQGPLGYEPNELPDCSTPHLDSNNRSPQGQTTLPCCC
jgi:hypothetical protein